MNNENTNLTTTDPTTMIASEVPIGPQPDPDIQRKADVSLRHLRPPESTLRFNPTAWAKLMFLRDLGETEVGGFGITPADDLLLVEDVRLVGQVCSNASVAFDDEAVADFFDQQVDRGMKPEQFARIWVHTHPGNWADPSGTDEDTFARVFARAQWAAMFILARGGNTHARLRFNVGPGGEATIPVSVDYRQPFAASDHAAWEAEYLACVQPELPLGLDPRMAVPRGVQHSPMSLAAFDEEDWFDWGTRIFDQPTGEEGFHEQPF